MENKTLPVTREWQEKEDWPPPTVTLGRSYTCAMQILTIELFTELRRAEGCPGEGAPNTMLGYKPLNGTTEFQEAAQPLHSNKHHRCAQLDTDLCSARQLNTH